MEFRVCHLLHCIYFFTVPLVYGASLVDQENGPETTPWWCTGWGGVEEKI